MPLPYSPPAKTLNACLLALALLVAAPLALAQTATTYNYIDISTTGTPLGPSDDGEVNITSPFQILWADITTTDLRVGNNGCVIVGATTGNVFAGNLDLTSVPAGGFDHNGNLACPLWDDWDTEVGNVWHQTIGTTPNRILIVQWVRPHFSGTATSNPVAFQVQFFEGGTTVEFHYEDVITGLANENNGASATIGVRGEAGGTFEARQFSFNTAGINNGDALQFSATNTLPVELTAFEGRADGQDVLLNWTTASETNNAGFAIELRPLGANVPHAEVAFVAGQGTVTEEHTYAHRVAGLVAGSYAFRLRQVDFDGASTLSEEVEVEIGIEGTHALSAAWPSPVRGVGQIALSVAASQHVNVSVYDLTGRHIQTLLNGSMTEGVPATLSFDSGALPAGIYLVRAQGEAFTETRRVVVVR